jgi:hypothetical protein
MPRLRGTIPDLPRSAVPGELAPRGRAPRRAHQNRHARQGHPRSLGARHRRNTPRTCRAASSVLARAGTRPRAGWPARARRRDDRRRRAGAGAAVVLRAGLWLVGEAHRGRHGRREHAALVAATGRPGPERDVVVLDHGAHAVYCLTSVRHRIVVSADALAAFTPEQIRAVLARECAHLRCRHHAMLTLTTALARAFPRVPLLAQAADDDAVHCYRRDDLAAAGQPGRHPSPVPPHSPLAARRHGPPCAAAHPAGAAPHLDRHRWAPASRGCRLRFGDRSRV